MARVRSGDKTGGLVPYTPGLNEPYAGSSNSKSSKVYDGEKAKGLAIYNSNTNGNGSESVNFTKGSNYAAGPGNHVPSAPMSNSGPGGGATTGNDSDNFAQSAPQRSQDGGIATGYPVINAARDGGDYVALPVPVSRWPGYGPTPQQNQQNGWLTTNEPENYQVTGSGKKFGSGGGGGDGPHGYGWPNGSLSGSEKHHHHHYYYNNHHQLVPYNTPQPEEKRRRRGARALVAALIACWVCTCCCHVPCGC